MEMDVVCAGPARGGQQVWLHRRRPADLAGEALCREVRPVSLSLSALDGELTSVCRPAQARGVPLRHGQRRPVPLRLGPPLLVDPRGHGGQGQALGVRPSLSPVRLSWAVADENSRTPLAATTPRRPATSSSASSRTSSRPSRTRAGSTPSRRRRPGSRSRAPRASLSPCLSRLRRLALTLAPLSTARPSPPTPSSSRRTRRPTPRSCAAARRPSSPSRAPTTRRTRAPRLSSRASSTRTPRSTRRPRSGPTSRSAAASRWPLAAGSRSRSSSTTSSSTCVRSLSRWSASVETAVLTLLASSRSLSVCRRTRASCTRSSASRASSARGRASRAPRSSATSRASPSSVRPLPSHSRLCQQLLTVASRARRQGRLGPQGGPHPLVHRPPEQEPLAIGQERGPPLECSSPPLHCEWTVSPCVSASRARERSRGL